VGNRTPVLFHMNKESRKLRMNRQSLVIFDRRGDQFGWTVERSTKSKLDLELVRSIPAKAVSLNADGFNGDQRNAIYLMLKSF